MYKQPTSDEYDIAMLIAERDSAISGISTDEDTAVGGEFITKKSFLRVLRKVTQQIDKAKSSPKPSET